MWERVFRKLLPREVTEALFLLVKDEPYVPRNVGARTKRREETGYRGDVFIKHGTRIL